MSAPTLPIPSSATIEFRGSVTDLATDVADHVSAEKLQSFIDQLRLKVLGSKKPKTKTGIERITDERSRQVLQEGYSSYHDDQHDAGELAWAASCYAAPVPIFLRVPTSHLDTPGTVAFESPWPWSEEDDRRPNRKFPTRRQRIRVLEKAGALVAAEIDRLLREEERVREDMTRILSQKTKSPKKKRS